MLIYRIRCVITDQSYIAATKLSSWQVWLDHKRKAAKNDQSLISRAIRHYTPDKFVITSEAVVKDPSQVQERLKYFQKVYNTIENGFNERPTVKPQKIVRTPETREKIRKARLGKRFTKKARQSISKGRKGKGKGPKNAMANVLNRIKLSQVRKGLKRQYQPDGSFIMVRPA